MRHGRAKAARKTLQYFKRLTGLSPPYQILLDATIIATLFQQHVLPVKERIDKVLQTYGSQNNVNTYCVTKSALDELEMIYKSLLEQKNKTTTTIKAEAFQQAIQWIKRECKILEITDSNQSEQVENEDGKDNNNNKKDDDEEEDDSSRSSFDNNDDDKNRQNKKKKNKRKNHHNEWKSSAWTKAQKDMILCIEQQQQQQQQDNQGHHQSQDQRRPFVIGSQDETILDEIRMLGLNPIIRLANQSVLLLEQPSKASQSQTKRDETRKWKSTCLKSSEKQLVDIVFQNNKKISKSKAVEASLEGRQLPIQQRPKGKAKGPNPLSCKKRKSNDGSAAATNKKESSSSKRRKRAKAAKSAKQQQKSES